MRPNKPEIPAEVRQVLPSPGRTPTAPAESAETPKSGEPDVLVGEITAPFGIRGQVKMRPFLDRPEHLATLNGGVRLRWDARPERVLRVIAVRPHQEAVVVSLEGVTDRNAAETLRGAHVLVRRSELPTLEPDAYYEADLIGMQVVTESGQDLGAIERVYLYPNSNDVYETPVAMIPAVADEIVLRVDLEGRTITVRDIPGLRKDDL